MELWIRSQNKTRLYKAQEIRLDNIEQEEIFVNESFFGKYKSKERALEVLNEIQNFIERKDITGNRYYEGKIYNMPKK